MKIGLICAKEATRFFFFLHAISLVSGFLPSHGIGGDTSPSSRKWTTRLHNHCDEKFNPELTRRSALTESVASVTAIATAAFLNTGAARAQEASAISKPTIIAPSEAVVTDKVFFDVRISRQDGTFYVRDDLEDIPENRVFSGRLIVGLFGKSAPNHVKRFLSYVEAQANPLDDNPLPSYGRSTFTKLDQASGVLSGGYIPSLEVTEMNGASVLRYGGRLFPASLWVERDPTVPRVTHSAKGLLTHRQFDATPEFGVTTRTDTRFLDLTQTVFGQIQADAISQEFLGIVQDLPVYSVERPTSMTPLDPAKESVDDAARAVFNAQRDFFRGAAKSFGDTRVSKVYQGKLLRRVEVTRVGLL